MIPGEELLFCALGGSGEIGMNVNLYGTQGQWLMVDLGLTFAGALRSLRARRTKLSEHIDSLTSSLKPQVEEEALVFTFGGATAAADASPGTGDAAEDNKKVTGRSAKASPVKRRGRRIL